MTWGDRIKLRACMSSTVHTAHGAAAVVYV